MTILTRLNTADGNITLHKTTEHDLPFLKSLYNSTRQAELAMTNFSTAEKQQFLNHQFQAQYTHYHTRYNTDRFTLIEVDSEPAGRLYIDEWSSELRIVDISLIEKWRNKGIGTQLLTHLFAEAKEKQKPVSIHVEHNNPARNLYERLGFKLKTHTNEIYLLMEWTPALTEISK